MTDLVLANPDLLRQAARVGARWVAANGEGIAVHNPATRALLGHVPKLSTVETVQAIEAAQTAQYDWAR